MKTIVIVMCLVSAAFADEAPPNARTKDNEGFEPVAADMMQKGESIPASTLVGGAYGFIMMSLVVFVATVVMRVRRVEDEMDALRRKLDKGK
jgi:hypothetical protein